MQLTLEQWVRGLRTEFRRKKIVLVLMFSVVALAMLVAGIYMPKRYEASTTILIGEKNIIEPLMEGRAVQTDVRSYSRNAKEILSNRRVVEDVIQHGGWDMSKFSAVSREGLIEGIIEQTRIQNVGANLLKISYFDTDAERAFQVTQRLAELFIEESTQAKQNESREAFEFIDGQVNRYHQKLLDAERNLKEFRGGNVDARPGSQSAVDATINQLRQQISQTRLQLSESREKAKSLQKQLSGEAVFNMHIGKEEQLRDRISALQNQKENLLLNYYDTHPDVVRLTHQIGELDRALGQEIEQRNLTASGAANGNESRVRRSPLYQDLRRQAATARTQIATLITRLRLIEESLGEEMDRSVRVADSEAQLAELTRDYEVNRNIYQDLLRRKENARVSMDMDMEGQSLAFIIKEPAALPVNPKGLGLSHFAMAGLVLGIMAPIGYMVLLIQVDPRVRVPIAIRQDLGLRVLASIPPLYTPSQRVFSRVLTVGLAVLALGVIVVYAYVGYLRYARNLF